MLLHQLFLCILTLVILCYQVLPCTATTPETIPLIVNDGTYQPDPSSPFASMSLPSLLSFLSKRGIRCYHCQTREDYLRVAEQVKDEPEVKDPVVFSTAPGDPDDIVTAGTIGGNARDPDNEAQQVPPKLLSRSDFASWTIPALRSFVTARGRSCDTCTSHDDWVTQAHLYQHLRVHATAGVEATTTKIHEEAAEPVYQARVTTGDQTIRPKSEQHDTLPSLTLDQLRTFARARGRECSTCTTHAHWLREAQFVAHKRPLATAGAGAGAGTGAPVIPTQTETAAAAAAAADTTTPSLSKKDEL